MYICAEVIYWANEHGYRTSIGIGGVYYPVEGDLLAEEVEVAARAILDAIDNPAIEEYTFYTENEGIAGHFKGQVISIGSVTLKEFIIN